MQVYLDNDGERTGIPVDLIQIFPEAGEYAAAAETLKKFGVYSIGGGAAPAVKLIATRKIVTNSWTVFGWTATFDNYDGAPDSHHPIGTGTTEQQAIIDLLGCED